MRQIIKAHARTALLAIGAIFLSALIPACFPHKAEAREQATITVTTLQSAATTGNGTTLGSGTMSQCRETAVYVVWGAGTNAGAITVESSYDSAYTGTWASLSTDTWSAASKQDIIQITGIHANLRARISTTVTGGTVSVYAICN